MKGLFKVLPPFAPDYSGVCSTLFELGGIAVIYDAGGCTGNFTGYDEPRWFGSSSAIFSGELREIDAVLGDDEKFIQKLSAAAKSLERSFVAILGSPAPMVMGTDYKALADIVSEQTGLPAFFFDTNGIEYYDQGISMALTALARTIVKQAPQKKPNTVNIIGATPLDFGKGRQIEELVAFLEHEGVRIHSIWAMGSSLDAIANSAEAALNIVISRSGLEAARYLRETMEMPYIVGVPVGHAQSAYFPERLNGRAIHEHEPDDEQGTGTVLVLGEQVLCNAIRTCLEMDFGFRHVTVASYFAMDKALTRQGDVLLVEERDLSALTQRGNFDVIIGDPLYRELVVGAKPYRFIAVPHIALSSRLYWEHEFSLIGEKGAQMLQEALASPASGTGLQESG